MFQTQKRKLLPYHSCYTYAMLNLFVIVPKLLLFAGSVLQIVNAIRFFRFATVQRDAASGQSSLDRRLGYVVGVFILFFTPIYVYAMLVETLSIWLCMLLLGGAVFVYVVLTWIFSLVGSVRRSMLELSQTLVSVMEASDPNLNGHSRHVQNLALLLYDNLPKKKREGIRRNDLGYAALFHDIGKLGISDFIIQKAGPLDTDEMDLVRDHPRIGADILSTVESFSDVAQWVLYHHERVDGTGYYRIPGNEIPLASRLLAVVDTFSAVTMRRSYKDPMSYDKGISVLREVAGTQLDAELVNAFCAIPHTQVLACAPSTIEIVGNPTHGSADD